MDVYNSTGSDEIKLDVAYLFAYLKIGLVEISCMPSTHTHSPTIRKWHRKVKRKECHSTATMSTNVS